MKLMKQEEMFELGRHFIKELAFNGEDPIKEYILKENSSSIKQRTESKVYIMKLAGVAEKMRLHKADKDELLRIFTYACVLLETQEHTMDIKKAKDDFRVEELERKYA